MKKDRFVAFFDAIMAIIMTIAVLEFAVPNGARWSDLNELAFQVVVYALSFFWLGMMWVNIHNLWNYADYISRPVIVVNIVMLFFSSMIPFLVIYVGRFSDELVPQMLYGIDVICISICNHISSELLIKENPQLKGAVKALRLIDATDMGIKLLGFVIGMTVYPPAVMFSVFIAAVILLLSFFMMKKRIR